MIVMITSFLLNNDNIVISVEIQGHFKYVHDDHFLKNRFVVVASIHQQNNHSENTIQKH